MIITKSILIALFMSCLVLAKNEKNNACIELLSKGYPEVDFVYKSNINDTDVAVVCNSRGSAFRRTSVEIFSFSDGKLKSLLAATFNATTVKIEDQDGILFFKSGVSGKVLISVDLKYIIISDKVLVDDTTCRKFPGK